MINPQWNVFLTRAVKIVVRVGWYIRVAEMRVCCRMSLLLNVPRPFWGLFEGYVLKTNCTAVNGTIRGRECLFHQCSGQKRLYGQRRAGEDSQGSFSHVRKLLQHSLLQLTNRVVRPIKIEKHSFLCLPWKQMWVSFTRSHRWACQKAVLAIKDPVSAPLLLYLRESLLFFSLPTFSFLPLLPSIYRSSSFCTTLLHLSFS